MKIKKDVATPNEPKLSDGPGWRGPCLAEGKVAAEARAVTARPVRCSAWLGVGVRRRTDPEQDARAEFSARTAPPKGCRAGEAESCQTFDNLSPGREENA